MILFVCEGNICRSPVAAALLTKGLADAGVALTVASAGTRALIGSPADPTTSAVAAQQGIGLSEHRARQLDRATAASATVLLAASRRIRSAAVAIHPPSVRYAFTLRQLGRILTETGFIAPAVDPHERIAELVRHTTEHRGRYLIADPAADDVIDPFGQPAETHVTAIGQIRPAVEVLARALGRSEPDWR